MSSAKFEVKQLTLQRAKRPILTDANLHVNPGEIVCLLGPSGSGKSSLLRCLNRLTEPPSDTVFVDGQDVTRLAVVALRQRVGMVFQKAALFPGTVAENLAYGPHLRDDTLSETAVDRLLSLVDLPLDYARRESGELSGGEAQRVALARTLATEPEALLLDEPTSALDPAATRHIETAILELRQKLGLTALWITHNVDQTRRVADRVYLLLHGEIVDEGTPQHLLRTGSRHLTAVFAAGELE